METQQTFMHNKGTWRANQTLLSFIETLLANDLTMAVVQDSRDNPIEIDDLHEFQEIAFGKYNESMNEFLIESNKLSKARSIKKAMDW